MRTVVITAFVSSLLTLAAVHLTGAAGISRTPNLENGRVRVYTVTYPPGSPRAAHTRESDQVIVFLDDCRYERTLPGGGGKQVQTRKAGDVIWHGKGEHAHELVNVGGKPYRSVVVEIK